LHSLTLGKIEHFEAASTKGLLTENTVH